ncbi:TetR/AcrR family transcriptional regulator [Streptacidiphilus sp. N1-3]|uniref:TetR/AcrR family transcriptional regulator n=1 Tax=Streptacidiphilus alkalitolerans TaxID=3342712 RepID=A0ABV6WZS3_9ACTN
MAKPGDAYHHGDLRAACLRAARELLEEDGAELSLRAVARRAGVSANAPYRHFPDRDALVSAVAAQGYRELAAHLTAAHARPSAPEDGAEIAVAYVRFALDHPALFRVMFAEPCDPGSPERVAAVSDITGFVETAVGEAFPGADPGPLATAIWALVHGLAFLHLDGKLDAATPEQMAQQVRAAFNALFTAAASTGAGADAG